MIIVTRYFHIAPVTRSRLIFAMLAVMTSVGATGGVIRRRSRR
jgi:hypothetical protein